MMMELNFSIIIIFIIIIIVIIIILGKELFMKLMRVFKFALFLFTLISTLISATLISVIFAPNSRYIPEGIALLYQGGDPSVLEKIPTLNAYVKQQFYKH